MSKERVNDLRERGEWTLGPKNPSRGEIRKVRRPHTGDAEFDPRNSTAHKTTDQRLVNVASQGPCSLAAALSGLPDRHRPLSLRSGHLYRDTDAISCRCMSWERAMRPKA